VRGADLDGVRAGALGHELLGRGRDHLVGGSDRVPAGRGVLPFRYGPDGLIEGSSADKSLHERKAAARRLAWVR
jgi:hypothetical protein